MGDEGTLWLDITPDLAAMMAAENLHVLLQTLPAPVLRGEVLPERVPSAGLLILRDGDPGEPAVTLSPLRFELWLETG